MKESYAWIAYDLLTGVKGYGILDELAYIIDLIFGVIARKTFSPNSLPGHFLFKDVCLKVKARGALFYCPAGTDILFHILPYYERKTTQFVNSILRPGDTFIDVGAHAGVYTIPAARIVDPGLVVAIEPSPINKILLRNIKLNGLRNVILVSKAAYSERKMLDLYYDLQRSGLSSIVWQRKDIARRIGGGKVNLSRIKVEAEPLDEILAEIGLSLNCVKLLKIDVEGAEVHVLSGAHQILRKTKYVIFETGRETSGKCLKILKSFNFRISLLERSRLGRHNYLAVKT